MKKLLLIILIEWHLISLDSVIDFQIQYLWQLAKVTFNDTTLIYQDVIQIRADKAITQEFKQGNKFTMHIIGLLKIQKVICIKMVA